MHTQKERMFVLVALMTFMLLPCNVQGCGGNLTSQNGTIQSPGFPSNYSNDLDCVWIISRAAGERITLTFEQFDLEGGDGCPHDFVEIRDGDSEKSTPILRTCNSSIPSAKRSFQNSLWIRFRSDTSVTGKGFNATYTSGMIEDKFFLITSSSRRIYRMDVDTNSNIALPIPILFNPIALDYDPVQGRLYWTDVIIKQVLSAFLNGSDYKTVRTFNTISLLDGLAIDPLSRLVFYADAGNDVIGMMTMSGASHSTIISTELDQPRAIVLDTMNGVMFWTDWGTPAKIERANYDGTDRRTLHHLILLAPNALALDLHNNRLYWADAGTDLVEWSDLDGNSRTQIFALQGHHLFGMTHYGDQLYVTDWTGAGAGTSISYLHRLSTDGSSGTMFGSVPGRLNDIHIYVESSWQRDPNGCGSNNGGCQFFCMPTPGNQSKCLCPDPPTDCSVGPTATTTTITTASPTSTTSTTTITPAPDLVTIDGPSVFNTDGTLEVSLTCDPNDPRVVALVRWSGVSCKNQEDRTCVWKPRPPEDDGKEVRCYIVYRDGRSGIGTFTVTLNYPPTAPPEIHGYKTGDVLQAGADLMMTCLVRGGKPLVTSVIFSCPGHPDSQDLRGDSETQSLLVIKSLEDVDHGKRCICTAEWEHTSLYALSATRILNIEVPQSAPREDSQNTGKIIGGVVGAGAFIIIVVIVIIIIVRRRGRDKYEHPSQPIQEVEMNPYARLGQPEDQRDLHSHVGHQDILKDEDRVSRIYAEIEDEEDPKGGKQDLSLHLGKAADDYLHLTKPTDAPTFHPTKAPYDTLLTARPTDGSLRLKQSLNAKKPADDYLHPATPTDDYLHPTKPKDLHPTKPTDDYLHPTKPSEDYLHPTKPTDDYLQPTKPTDDYIHPPKPT